MLSFESCLQITQEQHHKDRAQGFHCWLILSRFICSLASAGQDICRENGESTVSESPLPPGKKNMDLGAAEADATAPLISLGTAGI